MMMKKYYLILLFFISLLGYSQVGALQPDGSRAVIIAQPAEIKISGTSVDVTGFNLSNGQISSYAVTGGTPFSGNTYTETWTRNGSLFTMTDITKLSAGEYKVSIIDSKNCQSSKTFIINQPAELVVNISIP